MTLSQSNTSDRHPKSLKDGPVSAAPQMPAWKQIAPYLLLVIAVLAAYANIYGNQFLLDDEFLIYRNRFISEWKYAGTIFLSSSTAGWGGIDPFYRPLQTLLYLLIYQFFDLSLAAFHFLNMALHAANACLVYALGRRLGFKSAAVFLATLIWSLHPIHTEAVTYMSATADPLYAFFCLLGVLVLLPDFTPRKMFVASCIFVLGLLSKEAALVFPLLAMSVLFLTSVKRWQLKTYVKTWPLWLVLAAYILARFTVLNFSGFDFYKEHNIYTDHLDVRIFTFLASLPEYLRILLWPSDLHMDRALAVPVTLWRPPVLGGALLVLVALAQIIGTRGPSNASLGWGLLWFGAAYAPNTGIFLPINALILEHWTYLPSAGLFLGVAQSLAARLERIPVWAARSVVAAAILLAATFGILTFMQNRVWHDPILFNRHIISYDGGSARAHGNLGMAYDDAGDFTHAIEEYRTAISKLDNVPQAHHNLALALLQQSADKAHIAEAIAEEKRAIMIDPNFYPAYDRLVLIYERTGDMAEAGIYRRRSKEVRQKLNLAPLETPDRRF